MAAADICGLIPALSSPDLSKPTEDSQAVIDHFRRWRPLFHLMAPKGWMNDPCALGFDPVSSRYITAFQWNPNGNDWGDIAWGHASSPDLMSWTVSERPSLYPEASYDRCGVFTGCLLRGNANGEADGTLICFYTSVSKLPISYLLPYNVGCESLSAATSINGGVTWERCTKNPIIPHSPEGVKVTGWRDPYVAPWPAADKALDRKAGRYLYGCISGGISGETPTTFLYSIQSSDLQQWEYLGPLIKVGLNNSYSNWSGDLGLNWEVTTFCTLSDHTGSARSFIVAGAEGGLERVHAQLWISGSLQAEVDPASKISMTHDFGGVFDHGCLYASNAFWDPVAKEQVVISWIPEDDLPDALRHRQNWSGMLSLPRVLRLLCYERVAGTLATPLKDISCFEMQPDSHGTWTARTLGFLPDPRVELLRRGATHSQIEDLQLTSSKASEEATLPLRTLQWEIDAEIALEPTCKSVSLTIGHSTDLSTHTAIVFQPDLELLTLRRTNPSPSYPEIKAPLITAPHTLFTSASLITGAPTQETLRIRAFFDQSALEIFVNDRTALTARVYVEEPRCAGAWFEAQGGARVVKAEAWDGLRGPETA